MRLFCRQFVAPAAPLVAPWAAQLQAAGLLAGNSPGQKHVRRILLRYDSCAYGSGTTAGSAAASNCWQATAMRGGTCSVSFCKSPRHPAFSRFAPTAAALLQAAPPRAAAGRQRPCGAARAAARSAAPQGWAVAAFPPCAAAASPSAPAEKAAAPARPRRRCRCRWQGHWHRHCCRTQRTGAAGPAAAPQRAFPGPAYVHTNLNIKVEESLVCHCGQKKRKMPLQVLLSAAFACVDGEARQQLTRGMPELEFVMRNSAARQARSNSCSHLGGSFQHFLPPPWIIQIQAMHTIIVVVPVILVNLHTTRVTQKSTAVTWVALSSSLASSSHWPRIMPITRLKLSCSPSAALSAGRAAEGACVPRSPIKQSLYTRWSIVQGEVCYLA